MFTTLLSKQTRVVLEKFVICKSILLFYFIIVDKQTFLFVDLDENVNVKNSLKKKKLYEAKFDIKFVKKTTKYTNRRMK